jgi:hypothetical protein
MKKRKEDKTIYLLKIWLMILTVLCIAMLILILDNRSNIVRIESVTNEQISGIVEDINRCCYPIPSCKNVTCPEGFQCTDNGCVQIGSPIPS